MICITLCYIIIFQTYTCMYKVDNHFPLCSSGPLGAYVDRTFTLTLPLDLTVHNIDWFSVWCVPFRQNFGEVKIPDNVMLGGGIQVPTLPPIQCPVVCVYIIVNVGIVYRNVCFSLALYFVGCV